MCSYNKLTLWDEKLLLNDRFAASRTIPGTKKTALLLTSVKLHDGGEQLSECNHSRQEQVIRRQAVQPLQPSSIHGYIIVDYDGFGWLGCC